MTYTLHNERTDGTLDDAFSSYPTKAAAIRVAKILATQQSFDVIRLIVNDCNGMTVHAFTLPKWLA